MKKIVFFLIAVTFTLAAGAQKISNGYLMKIPALPVDTCNITRAGITDFTNQVSGLSAEISAEISRLNKLAKTSAGNSEAASKEEALKQMSQYGMSQEDMEKMKNSKNMSAADKQAMASKMMSQQTNMSMDEIKNLSKMSDAGKQAYAEGYATEAMAVSQTNPKSQPVNSSVANLSALVGEQQALTGKIATTGQKIGNLYSGIENDPAGQEMLDRMGQWKSQWVSMGGVDYGQGQQMDSLDLLIKKEQIKYCDKYTQAYRAALLQHLTILKSSLPDYQRLGEVTAEITMTQTGVVLPPETRETEALKAVKEYINKLDNAYQFKLYFPEDD